MRTEEGTISGHREDLAHRISAGSSIKADIEHEAHWECAPSTSSDGG